MNFQEYQTRAAATAIYPGRGKDATYPALGVGGELSEIAARVDQANAMKRDCPPEAQAALPKRLAGLRLHVKAELGDVLWYVSALCDEAGFSLQEVADEAFQGGMPEDRKESMSDVTLRMVAKLGRAGEIVKKYMRDDKKKWTADRKAQLRACLVAGLVAWAEVGRQWELPGPEIRAENIAKLASRQDRGVLQGSGDNR